MNTMRGQITAEVGGSTYPALINLNALRLFTQAADIKLSEVQTFAADYPMDFLCRVILAGIRNAQIMGLHPKGDEHLPDYELLAAHLLSDQEQFTTLSEQVSAVMGTDSEAEKKPQAEG